MSGGPASRVLVATYDKLGPQMAGPAIRAWELSGQLAREHEVVLAAFLPPERRGEGFDVRHCDRAAFLELVAWCDVVVAFGYLLVEYPEIVEQGKFVVADVYDPFHLEVLVGRALDPRPVQDREHRGALAGMLAQLRVADLVLVASERQRHLVLGMLSALNRVNPATYADDPSLESLVSVVPFGLPSGIARAEHRAIRGVHPGIGEDDFVLLWAGGIYEWLDPVSVIEAVARLADDGVKLFFMGTAHPNPSVERMPVHERALRRAEDLGVRDCLVFFNDGWVPYDERAGYLLEADVGVSTHLHHVETAYAFRTRMLDYIWAALPVLCTEGDTLADLVAARDLGVVVPPSDPGALADAITALRDDDRRKACAAHLAELAEELSWDRVARPVVEFCRRPHHAADRTGTDAAPAVESELRAEIERLRDFERRVKKTLPYRAYARARQVFNK